MEDKEFEFVDQDYAHTSSVKPSRQIRTRKNSHDNILSAFTRSRIAMLKYELEHQKTLAVTENYIGSKEKMEQKADKRARKIAKLEERIKILSLEDVPENYVDDRAIKLKEAMMSHLRSYTGLMYTIGIGKESEVFDNVPEPTGKEVVEQIATEVGEEIGDSALDSEESEEVVEQVEEEADDEIVIEPTSANVKEIKAKVEEGFKKAEKTASNPEDAISADEVKKVIDGEFVNVEDYIGTDEVKRVIDGAFDRLENEDSRENGEGAVSIEDFVMPYDEALSTVVDEDLMPYEDSISTVVDEDLIPYDETISGVFDETTPKSRIEGEINKAMKNLVNPPKGDELLSSEDKELKDVIREEVRSALEHYDNDLKKTVRDPRFNYKPMTDAEIAEAREKIGDQYNTPSITGVFVPVEQVKNASSKDVRVEGPALRDEIIVVPEREASGLSKSSGKVEEYEFTSVDSKESLPQAVSRKVGSYDSKKLKGLREKIAELQSAKEAARRNAIEAEERLQEADRHSRKIRSDYEAKAAALEKQYEEYAAALTDSINSFDNSAKLANDAAAMEERFIKTQEGINSELDEEIAVVSRFGR